MDENIIIKQPFNNRYTKHIKGALIINLKDWRKQQQITILVKEYSIKRVKYNPFKIIMEDKP